jgi:hypothetical protein
VVRATHQAHSITFDQSTISASMKQKLMENHDYFMSQDKMQVNPEMYPKQVLEGSVRSLKVYLNSPELHETFKSKDIYGIEGISGSFRKLEID